MEDNQQSLLPTVLSRISPTSTGTSTTDGSPFASTANCFSSSIGCPDSRVRGPVCTSTAQELAFRAFVETAIGCLDEGTDSQQLVDFHNQSVEVTDIEFLFDPALDGLAWPDPEVDGVDER